MLSIFTLKIMIYIIIVELNLLGGEKIEIIKHYNLFKNINYIQGMCGCQYYYYFFFSVRVWAVNGSKL